METEIELCDARGVESTSVSPKQSNKTKEDESSIVGMWKLH